MGFDFSLNDFVDGYRTYNKDKRAERVDEANIRNVDSQISARDVNTRINKRNLDFSIKTEGLQEGKLRTDLDSALVKLRVDRMEAFRMKQSQALYESELNNRLVQSGLERLAPFTAVGVGQNAVNQVYEQGGVPFRLGANGQIQERGQTGEVFDQNLGIFQPTYGYSDSGVSVEGNVDRLTAPNRVNPNGNRAQVREIDNYYKQVSIGQQRAKAQAAARATPVRPASTQTSVLGF